MVQVSLLCQGYLTKLVGEIFVGTNDACDASESVIDIFWISSKSSVSSDSRKSSDSSDSSKSSESSESSMASASVGRLSSYFNRHQNDRPKRKSSGCQIECFESQIKCFES